MSVTASQELQKSEADLKRLDALISQDPTNAVWHWRRGTALIAMANFARARDAFEKAISLLPRYADAWAGLGEIHARAGNRKAARRAFRTAIDIDPLTTGALAGYRAHTPSWEFLAWRFNYTALEYLRRRRRSAQCAGAAEALQEALALANRGQAAAAIDVLRQALSRCPGNIDLTKLLSGCLFLHGNTEHSRQTMKKLVEWWPDDAQAHYAYGACLATMGDMPASAVALERALKLSPDNYDIRVALAVASKGTPPKPRHGTTRDVFDSYAERFDEHLVGQLRYRVPEKLGEIFASAGRMWDRVLDLGCGTGLVGASLRPYARHLTGVDLSPQMIEKAKTRGVYDSLYQDDCVAFLQQTPTTFDVMIAADVLVYIGDLTELFRAIRSHLLPGGVFWFSVEDCDGDGFSVMLTQRYQHSLPYLRATAQATGLRVIHEQPIDLRLEGHQPVPGRLVAIERPDERSGAVDPDRRSTPGA